MKKYKLLGADGNIYLSDLPGTLGGNSKAGIYGRLNCSSATRALSDGYAQHRVFFESESVAVAAGYRPCGNCMRHEYKIWKESSAEKV